MTVVFLDCCGTSHGITAERYLSTMHWLHNTIHKHQPALWRADNWLLHHGGAPAHQARCVHEFVQNTGTRICPQPPCSPDLSPADYWLLECMKKDLRGHRFQNVNALINQIHAVVSQITPVEFGTAFCRYRHHAQSWENSQGDVIILNEDNVWNMSQDLLTAVLPSLVENQCCIRDKWANTHSVNLCELTFVTSHIRTGCYAF